MNLAKSALGSIPAPASLTRRVSQSGLALTIVEEQKGGSGDHVFTRKYTTDGKEVRFVENGSEVKATATWDGDALVIHATADAGGFAINFMERMTLSEGSQVLTDAVHIMTPQGEISGTYVFDKH